jgi:hypothetical protein
MGSWSFRATAVNLAALGFCALALLGAAPTGAIFVSSLPSGADVWLDGTYVGRSPLVVDALAVGAHHLTLTRTGWTAEDLSVTIAAAQTQTTAVVLSRDGKTAEAAGTIEIHAADRLGAFAIDGQPATLGKAGTIAVGAGTHDLTIASPQGKQTRTVTVYPRTRTVVIFGADPVLRSIVVAPADDYLPAGAVHFDGTRLSLHYRGHEVTARAGATTYTIDKRQVTFDSPPTMVKNRIYLPLELLTMLTKNDKK